MKKLLVAVDFSPASINAARFAADMASQINAAIILFHVINITALTTGVSVSADVYNELEDEADLQLSGLREELSDRVMGKIPVAFKMTNGYVTAELHNFCKEISPLAIVMGAQGKRAIDRLMLGSVTRDTIKTSHYPILVIPSDAIFTSIKKIALASDMNNNSILPVIMIEYLVKLFSAQFEIVHVDKSEDKMNPTVLSESANLKRSLHCLNPDFHYIYNKDIAAGINVFVKDHHINMLFLTPKSRNLIADLFHKSVSTKICWHPTIPVMVLPEDC